MVETEIIVAIIGASVTLSSPFIALFIRKYCEKNKNNQDSKNKSKPKSICEIHLTQLGPPFYMADKRSCYLPKKVCPDCGLTFCEYHFSNNTNTNVGGHICSKCLQQP